MSDEPQRIRNFAQERIHHHRPLNTSAGGDNGVVPPHGTGSTPPAVDPDDIGCDLCGTPEGEDCAWWCMGEQIS